MVLETKKEANYFSIERLESVMLSAGLTWEDVNKEFKYDVKTIFKNKLKEPTLSEVNKICKYIGLENSDYVMMKSDSFNIKNRIIDYNDIIIHIDNIYIDILKYFINESGWTVCSLSHLLPTKRYLDGIVYSKSVRHIALGELNTICWAIKCNINDILLNKININIKPHRKIYSNQKYILNTKYIENTGYADRIYKFANMPKWFIDSDEVLYISDAMLIRIYKAIFQATNNLATFEELCINHDKVKYILLPRDIKKRGYNGNRTNESIDVKAKNFNNTIKKDKVLNTRETQPVQIAKTSNNIQEEKEMAFTNNNTTETNKKALTNTNDYVRYEEIQKQSLQGVINEIERLSNNDLENLEIFIKALKQYRIAKDNAIK